MEPGKSARESAASLGLSLMNLDSALPTGFLRLSTSRPGVFVAGAFQEPKDIPETVTQASAAASMSMELLAEARNSLVTKRVYPG